MVESQVLDGWKVCCNCGKRIASSSICPFARQPVVRLLGFWASMFTISFQSHYISISVMHSQCRHAKVGLSCNRTLHQAGKQQNPDSSNERSAQGSLDIKCGAGHRGIGA